MSNGDLNDLSEFSMLDLFRSETEAQAAVLTSGLLALEQGDATPERLAELMRAAHSLKGAARIVGAEKCAQVAHVMEDCFVAAQRGETKITPSKIDALLKGVDILSRLAKLSEEEMVAAASDPEIEAFAEALQQEEPAGSEAPIPAQVQEPVSPEPIETPPAAQAERSLRVQSEQVDRLLGVAAESMVESRRLNPVLNQLLRGRRLLDTALRQLDELHAGSQAGGGNSETVRTNLRTTILSARSGLVETMEELDAIHRRTDVVSARLYDGTLKMRMRPFGDVLHGLPRMVRDVARTLGKEARLEIAGEQTEVDREALERLETMLGHICRNALDHGIETPEERQFLRKPREGLLRIEASHDAGMLKVVVRDDGRGVDLEVLKAFVLRRKFADAANVQRMSESELLEFLFLPGFSVKETVTDISGRGVGLDAVQVAVRELRGTVRLHSRPGEGMEIEIHLPLTLSVLRTAVVDISGAPYAVPLVRISRVVTALSEEIQSIEGRQTVPFQGRMIGLIPASQLLGQPISTRTQTAIPIVCIGGVGAEYGLVVDRFAGVREVVVQTLDQRLGKVPGISAGALLPDGEPVLLLDVDDLLRAAEKISSTDALQHIAEDTGDRTANAKRILVVDDSLTVRELERKLLLNRGYQVEVAVDGMEAWHLARTRNFELVVTDVDMPRLDGIELTKLIKADPHLNRLPVMIVSYKDREEDRMRGLDAGADYYLAKGSFQDEKLLDAVEDLIGSAR